MRSASCCTSRSLASTCVTLFAQYMQRHLLPHLPEDGVAFSGSSGGALVAAALCTGIDIGDLTETVISCHRECQFNPFRMLP